MRGRATGRYGLFALWVLWMAPFLAWGADIVVSSATPSSAQQGTVALLVTIKGSGFPKKPQVKFCLTATGTGSCDPDKIVVTSAVPKGTTTIEATIDIGADASTTNFDIEVIEPLSGRKGRGTGLFAVLQKSTTSVEVPLGSFTPDFAYVAGTSTSAIEYRVSVFDGSVWSRVDTTDAANGVMFWSPDGRRLAYRKDKQTKAKGTITATHAWMVREIAPGSSAQTLDGDPFAIKAYSMSFNWSPTLADGKQYLFFVMEGPLSIGQVFARQISCTAAGCTLGPSIQVSYLTLIGLQTIALSADGQHVAASNSDSGQVVLYDLGFDASQAMQLSAPAVLANASDYGMLYLHPRFSAAYPAHVLFFLPESSSKPATVERLAFDLTNQPAGFDTLTSLPWNFGASTTNWSIDNAGRLMFGGSPAGNSALYFGISGSTLQAVPFPSNLDLARPVLRPAN